MEGLIKKAPFLGPFYRLPIVDTFRTFCLAPTSETREILDRFEELTLSVQARTWEFARRIALYSARLRAGEGDSATISQRVHEERQARCLWDVGTELCWISRVVPEISLRIQIGKIAAMPDALRN